MRRQFYNYATKTKCSSASEINQDQVLMIHFRISTTEIAAELDMSLERFCSNNEFINKILIRLTIHAFFWNQARGYLDQKHLQLRDKRSGFGIIIMKGF